MNYKQEKLLNSILMLKNADYTNTRIAATLKCSRTTVVKLLQLYKNECVANALWDEYSLYKSVYNVLEERTKLEAKELNAEIHNTLHKFLYAESSEEFERYKSDLENLKQDRAIFEQYRFNINKSVNVKTEKEVVFNKIKDNDKEKEKILQKYK